MKIEITDFDIKLNKESVLRAVGCTKESAVYETASLYFDELLKAAAPLFAPYGAAEIEKDSIYCVVTIGGGISDYSSRLFDSGEAMKGLIVNAMADEYLFEADKILSERIKRECAIKSVGVKNRLNAPGDFSYSGQKVIIDKTATDRVTVTDAFMLEPVKSLAYILELTDDTNIFNAQHDCSKCACKDCPRRSRAYRGGFEILSGYDFTPDLKENESAVCIDIGTTTVAFELVTADGAVKTYKTINPQRRFGLDVLSRIEAANRGRGDELSSAIRFALLKGYNELTATHGTPDRIVIAGNTTMVHLLMNYSCASLGEYPFKSGHLAAIETTLDKITSSEAAPVPATIYGGISAFVGGDIVSGMYMCDFDISEKINLFIDLGTNGEMAIGNRDKIIATSTAAGPAFEGGRISCGTGSVDGAISSVTLNPPSVKTIGDKPPVGICGTGIIELLSELKDNNIIDKTGLLSGDYFKNGYKAADNIVFTQSDIREVQMAKAAVRAGIECLMRSCGAEYGDIDKVYLAGGFGYGLSPRKACNIGILPRELENKTKPIGNSSLGGCVKYCSRTDGADRIKHIQSISKEFPLAENKEFERLYIEYMNF